MCLSARAGTPVPRISHQFPSPASHIRVHLRSSAVSHHIPCSDRSLQPEMFRPDKPSARYMRPVLEYHGRGYGLRLYGD